MRNLTCPKCGKRGWVISEMDLGVFKLYTLPCKHSITKVSPIISKPGTYEAIRAKTCHNCKQYPKWCSCGSYEPEKLYPFQIEACYDTEKAELRALQNHEMGLGKSVILACLYKVHHEMLPAAIFCKASLGFQWMKYFDDWADITAQFITASKEAILLDFFPITIFSIDLLRRYNGKLKDMGYKSVLLDECQSIKDPGSQRSQAFRDFCKDKEFINAASGTPAKNNGAELAPIIVTLKPERFHSMNRFVWDYVDVYQSGGYTKVGGLKNPKKFHEDTKDFIFRKTRQEVLPELPVLRRDFRYSDLGTEVEEAYKKAYEEFCEEYDKGNMNTFGGWSSLIAYMSRMRHLTGLAKVKPAIAFVEEFLLETNRKLVLFVHHRDVGYSLFNQIGQVCRMGAFPQPMQFIAEMNVEQRHKAVQDFLSSDCRILVASTLAAGEGLNLQPCADCVMVERQWNPPNEEQAEARFIRIGQTADSVQATYLVAVGTIDEYFAELVEKKRAILSTIHDRKLTAEELQKIKENWQEAAILKELAVILRAKGGQRWNKV